MANHPPAINQSKSFRNLFFVRLDIGGHTRSAASVECRRQLFIPSSINVAVGRYRADHTLSNEVFFLVHHQHSSWQSIG